MKKEIKEEIFSTVLTHGRAGFLFDQEQFEKNIHLLNSAFLSYYPKVTIGYSYKTNYIPVICRTAHEKGCWAEVVSEMEVEMAMVHLSDKSNIIYNGPVKSQESIRKIIEVGGIINVDDLHDLYHVDNILKDFGNTNIRAKIALRLNFEYEGNYSRFGIEISKIEFFLNIIDNNPAIELLGYHIHLPFRSIHSFKHRVQCIFEVLNIHGTRPLGYINIGGGFLGKVGPELAKNMQLKDLPSYKDYGQLIGDELTKYFNESCRDNWPVLFIEPGSSLVADVMWFISKINNIKKIGSKNIIVTFAARHLITPTNKTLQFPIELYQTKESNLNYVDGELYAVGFTCIESDVLGKVEVKYLSSSVDFIAIGNVGSYSIVMGSNFILPQPAIYILDSAGIRIIRAEKTTKSILGEFIY